jgi:hypothetical protein
MAQRNTVDSKKQVAPAQVHVLLESGPANKTACFGIETTVFIFTSLNSLNLEANKEHYCFIAMWSYILR